MRCLCCPVLFCSVLQLHDELGNARGINDLTADETTKVLLENSRLQQVRHSTDRPGGKGGGGLGFCNPRRGVGQGLCRRWGVVDCAVQGRDGRGR